MSSIALRPLLKAMAKRLISVVASLLLALPLIPFVAMLWHTISISCHLDWHQIVINDGLGQAAM